MRPLLRQWHGVTAGRDRAAPHIKTYGRITNNNTFDWFLLTSANLSKPAWGTQEGKPLGLRIRSYETGVLFDPSLWGEKAVMVPTIKSDIPSEEQVKWARENGYKVVVGIRVPWDLPFKKYDADDAPWVKNRSYEGTDWLGESWN
jgi:tyrosyl-DNA phosphodiesterase 1